MTKLSDLGAVRDKLAAAASSLLVGPLDPDEVIDSPPTDTYLTGILWPRGSAIGADDDGDLGAGDDDSTGMDGGVPGYRAIRPCSVGITFAVRAGAAVEVHFGATARYERVEIEDDSVAVSREVFNAAVQRDGQQEGHEGRDVSDVRGARRRKSIAWARKRLGYSVCLEPEEVSSTTRISTFLNELRQEIADPRLSLHVRRRVGPKQHVFTLTLINEEVDDPDSSFRDERCLFQAGLVVRALDLEVGVIQQRPRPPINAADEDGLSNSLLYRNVSEFAVGHGIAVRWGEATAESVSEVATAWLPKTTVYGTSPEGHSMLASFREKYPHALDASFLADESGREHVVAAMSALADCYQGWIERTLRGRVGDFKGQLRAAADQNLKRCALAAVRIRAGVDMLSRDKAAWTAFALANGAMDRQSRFRAKGEAAQPLVWRPFQIAFMLLVMPGLAEPTIDDRECMDLLWFPTGGGKTEAYLALTAFQIFHRRLIDEPRRKRGGVDVLMRYTLRLLTVQQFQRAASLVSACELMRQSDARLGEARITLGLYVGGDATPNSMEKARQALAEEQAGQRPISTPRQLLRCPVCGTELPAVAYVAHPLEAKIDITCSDKACEMFGTPLPVLMVDEAIYANPPSLLIGTIDKFAQLPRRTDIRAIFGLDGGMPPGLVIQDELHLISGPLGSMAGLYETIVDILCTREGVRPKVIGSTATIGRAVDQVRSLFDRSVLQFPPPGFDADDSFFAVRDLLGPNRLYVGIPTAGRSPKFALQALLAALLQSIDFIRKSGANDDEAIDRYWTCVAYFNSLRELGGAYVLMQDDVPRQMQFLAGRLKMARRDLQLDPVELSSRRSSRELPELLHALSATLARFNEDPLEHPEPKDSVLASNMISVGVDVPRLGLMVVNGQPKSTAEYIQASSRVGRGIPGLVVTLYNFGRPRDLSHFEHFRTYHDALYRSVEATSVTPWAPRARDKAMHAVVAALVRHLVPGLQGQDDAIGFDQNNPRVAGLVASILSRVSAATGGLEVADTKSDLEAIVDKWAHRSHEARTSGRKLRYWEKKAPFGRSTPHLMFSAEDGAPAGSLAWPTPNTMREVEPSTGFFLKSIPHGKGKT